jgi:hypothetical protein
MKVKNSFLVNLDDYAPTIPEAVTKFYMQKAGCEAEEERLVKLVSLAADHFLAKTVYEAKQVTLLRRQVGSGGAGRGKGAVKRNREEQAELEDLLQVRGLDDDLCLNIVYWPCCRRSLPLSCWDVILLLPFSLRDDALFLFVNPNPNQTNSPHACLTQLDDLQRALADQGVHLNKK